MTYKQIYKALKKKIEKGSGKRCKSFNMDCINCRLWLALDIIEALIDCN